MKKNLLFLVLVFMMGMLLCSCSGDSPNKMLGVKLPSGEKLQLYMSRDKVEEIMSQYEYTKRDKIYDYGFMDLRYTDGLLTFIYCREDSGATFFNGLGIGSTDYEKYGFGYNEEKKYTVINYKKTGGKYEQIEDYDRSLEFKEGVQVYLEISEEDKSVTTIAVHDIYCGNRSEFDE